MAISFSNLPNPKTKTKFPMPNLNFPSDIITDILIRLPVKTLLRFRCISKPVCHQIDGPDFIKLHLKNSIATKSNLSLILKTLDFRSVEIDSLDAVAQLNHPANLFWSGTVVFGSCNGLLALFNSDSEMVLWNPSTRKHKRLPIIPVERSRGVEARQFTYCGFGYDPISDDYKVVRMVQFIGQNEDGFFSAEVKVYSLKTNSWTGIKDLPCYLRLLFQTFYSVLYRRGNGVLAGSALHWVAPRGLDLYSNGLIVAFDLGVEEFRVVPQPDNVDDYFEMDVGVLEGSLCMVCNYCNAHVDVWVMKEYGVKESWSKLFKLSQSNITGSFGRLVPLAYSKSGDKVLFQLENEKFFWYDMRRGRAKRVRIQGGSKSYGMEICVGSLIPLGGGEVDQKKQKADEEKKKSNRKKRDDFLSTGFKLVL